MGFSYMTCNITCMADLLVRNAIQHQTWVVNTTQQNEYISMYPTAGQERQWVKKHGIMFFIVLATTSNNREIEIPFVSISFLYHLLGPTQSNKSRLLPNYNKQDVGLYMLSVNPMFKK
jgi:hypothetical protein